MKKILVVLCLILLTGCSQEKKENNIGMPNPMVSRQSLEEVNNITHGNITKPGVMGITQEGFYTIETDDGIIGEYDFVLNDMGYTIRFSDTIVKEDISGVWINGSLAFDDDLNNVRAEGADLKLARWFTIDGQYCFIAPNTVEDELFESMINELTVLSVTK